MSECMRYIKQHSKHISNSLPLQYLHNSRSPSFISSHLLNRIHIHINTIVTIVFTMSFFYYYCCCWWCFCERQVMVEAEWLDSLVLLAITTSTTIITTILILLNYCDDDCNTSCYNGCNDVCIYTNKKQLQQLQLPLESLLLLHYYYYQYYY